VCLLSPLKRLDGRRRTFSCGRVSSLCRTFAGSYFNRGHRWEENQHFIPILERKQLAGLWPVLAGPLQWPSPVSTSRCTAWPVLAGPGRCSGQEVRATDFHIFQSTTRTNPRRSAKRDTYSRDGAHSAIGTGHSS